MQLRSLVGAINNGGGGGSSGAFMFMCNKPCLTLSPCLLPLVLLPFFSHRRLLLLCFIIFGRWPLNFGGDTYTSLLLYLFVCV